MARDLQTCRDTTQRAEKKLAEREASLTQTMNTTIELRNQNSSLVAAKKASDREVGLVKKDNLRLEAEVCNLNEKSAQLSEMQVINTSAKIGYGELQKKYEELERSNEEQKKDDLLSIQRISKLSAQIESEQVRNVDIQADLKLKLYSALQEVESLRTKEGERRECLVSLESTLRLQEHELRRLAPFERRCEELKEINVRYIGAAEKDEITRRDLQRRLDTTQQKWEDLKSREDSAAGQVSVLYDKIAEAKGTQLSLVRPDLQVPLIYTSSYGLLVFQQREIKEFRDQITTLKEENARFLALQESDATINEVEDLKARLKRQNSAQQLLEGAMMDMAARCKQFESEVTHINDRFEDSLNLSRVELCKLNQVLVSDEKRLIDLLAEKTAECDRMRVCEKELRNEKDELIECLSDEKEKAHEFLDRENSYRRELAESQSKVRFILPCYFVCQRIAHQLLHSMSTLASVSSLSKTTTTCA